MLAHAGTGAGPGPGSWSTSAMIHVPPPEPLTVEHAGAQLLGLALRGTAASAHPGFSALALAWL